MIKFDPTIVIFKMFLALYLFCLIFVSNIANWMFPQNNEVAQINYLIHKEKYNLNALDCFSLLQNGENHLIYMYMTLKVVS